MQNNITLSEKQQEALDIILSGQNVFLTGKAGTGKSLVVNLAIKQLKSKGRKVVALAPTGIAANNINGQTIHSMFSITPYGVMTYERANFIKSLKRKLLSKIDTIVIDEVSMLRPDILDAINWTLIKNGCNGLQQKQIILIGDLKQLPSVIDDNLRSILYKTYDGDQFYDAKIYSKLNIKNIELDKIHRQNDIEFIENLNIIREGGKSKYFERFVNTETKGIVLAPHNSTVSKYNIKGLSDLKGEEITFKATIEGSVKATEFNVDETVNVKNGAKIMYLINSKNNPLVNGTLGTFVSHKGCHFIRVDNVDYALEPVKFVKKEYIYDEEKDDLVLKELGSITQYPIKLAYALSIHKSQGLTFDEITVDLTQPCFQSGQLYVALSRVKTPQGLRIIV